MIRKKTENVYNVTLTFNTSSNKVRLDAISDEIWGKLVDVIPIWDFESKIKILE